MQYIVDAQVISPAHGESELQKATLVCQLLHRTVVRSQMTSHMLKPPGNE